MDDTRTIPSQPALIAPVHREIEAYLADLAQSTDTPTLIGMESLAIRQSFPIVGRLCGVFLKTLALGIAARRVFEFGSGFGYSAHWFAVAVGPEGRVVCADSDPANLPLAEHFLKEAGLWDRVEFRIGQAQGVFCSVGGGIRYLLQRRRQVRLSRYLAHGPRAGAARWLLYRRQRAMAWPGGAGMPARCGARLDRGHPRA